MKVFVALLAVLAMGCSEDYLAEYCPANDGDDWLSEMIEDFKRTDQSAEVYYFVYNEQPTFLVNSCLGCADSMSILYNCDKGVVCQFGGIAGLNTCPDFVFESGEKKLLYRKN